MALIPSFSRIFIQYNSATISANDITISTNSFVNTHTRGDGNINADTLTLSLIGDFDYTTDYLGNGNINATTLNSKWVVIFLRAMQTITLFGNSEHLVVLGNASFNVDDFYNRGKIDVANDLTISANSFVNTHTEGDGNINADTLALSLIGDFDYASDFGNIDATNFNFQVGGDFTYDDANNNFVWNTNNSLVVLGNASFNVDDFYNKGKIDVANDLTISTNYFVNTHTRGDGNINADTLTLSLIGDFDYANEYLGNGNIKATNLNFQVGGDFSYNDTNNNFVWHANNSLVVLGSASFNVDDFYNRGKIDVANDFNVIAGNIFFNTQNATISANNFSVLTQDRFYNLTETLV